MIISTIDELDITKQADVEAFFSSEKQEYIFWLQQKWVSYLRIARNR